MCDVNKSFAPDQSLAWHEEESMEDQFDNDLLITEIEKRPSIWDMTSPQYKDRVIKRKHWEEVVEIFCPNGDVNEKKTAGGTLQKKWKNLRDSFAKELRKQKNLPSGSKAKSGTYIYFRQLQFLESSVASKETTSNIDVHGEEAQDHVDVTENEAAQITPAKKKLKVNSGDMHLANILERSLLARQTEAEQQNDEDKTFCLSLYKELKKVPEDQRLMTKIELLHVVHRAQRVNIPQPYMNQSYPYNYSRNTFQPQSSHFQVAHHTPHQPPAATVPASQPVAQTYHNMQTYPSTSGCNASIYNTYNTPTQLPTPSPGAESQTSETQSEYIDMYD